MSKLKRHYNRQHYNFDKTKRTVELDHLEPVNVMLMVFALDSLRNNIFCDYAWDLALVRAKIDGRGYDFQCDLYRSAPSMLV